MTAEEAYDDVLRILKLRAIELTRLRRQETSKRDRLDLFAKFCEVDDVIDAVTARRNALKNGKEST